MAEQEAEKASIQVIERMTSLLDVLADLSAPVSLKILARNTGLPPSTVHRILAAMTSAAIVERHDAGTYALVNGRAPLHLTSVGKLFLAAYGVADVRAYARRSGLPGKTAHSLTRLDALEKELNRIRRHEVAYDNEDAEIGLRCIAAPIRNDEGQLVAGLSVSAPCDRYNPDWVTPIMTTANEKSQALGYRKGLRKS